MTQVCDCIFSCELPHKIYLSRSIIFSKLVEAVIKVFLEMLRSAKLAVLSRVFIASIIPKPHIIAGHCCSVSWTLLSIQDPSICTRKKAMLEKCYWCLSRDSIRSMDVKDLKMVAITCNDRVLVKYKAEIFYNFLERPMNIIMNT